MSSDGEVTKREAENEVEKLQQQQDQQEQEQPKYESCSACYTGMIDMCDCPLQKKLVKKMRKLGRSLKWDEFDALRQ